MSHRNKILIFTDWYEPGFKAGGPIQSCKNIVNTLSDQFDFFIFTSDRDLGDSNPYPGITTDNWINLPNGAKVWYATPAFLKSSNIRKIITETTPDIIYLNSMFSSAFSLLPLWILRSMQYKGRIILAPRGMLNTSAVSRKKWKKKIFLSLFSIAKISKQIVFHATDRQEESDIKRFFPNNAQVKLIGNIPNTYDRWQPRDKQPGQLNCVFISRIHPIKNLLFAINAVKGVEGCHLLFDVYGIVEDEKYYQKCRQAVASLSPHIRINFKGPVANANIFSVLEHYHLFFLPTQGENFGHVVFEALAAGCVVLISDKTPWADVESRNAGWALPLDDTEKFTDKLRLLCGMSEPELNNKSRASVDYAKDHIAKLDLKGRYLNLFQTNN